MRKLILDSGLSSNKDTSQPLWRFSAGVRARHMRLNTLVLPLSYNNVLDTTNTISFGDGGTSHTATLRPGAYSGTQLADEVARALTEKGTQTYTVTFDAITGKLTVTAPGTFKILSSGTTAEKILGLKSDTTPGTTLTFPQPIDLTGVQMALLQIPEVSSAGAVVYAGRESLNVIDAIPITNDLGTVQVFQNHAQEFLDINDQVLSEISVKLLDSSTMKVIDLRGETFQVILDIL